MKNEDKVESDWKDIPILKSTRKFHNNNNDSISNNL